MDFNLILLLTINLFLLCTLQSTKVDCRKLTTDQLTINTENSSNVNIDSVNSGKVTNKNLTTSLSFRNTPISKGQILSPSNKVTTEIDSPSLIDNRNEKIKSTFNSLTNNDNSTHNDIHNSTRNSTHKLQFATNISTPVNSSNHSSKSSTNINHNNQNNHQAKLPPPRQRKLVKNLDKQVNKLYKEQKTINMINNPRLYEMLLKSKRSSDGVESITLGAILPKTALITKFRSYQKRLQDAVEDLMNAKNGVFHFLQRFRIAQAQLVLLSRNPTPTEILSALCEKLLPHNVSTIIYMSNSDTDDNNAASALYLMQLTSYLGIPVIAWNPDNIGLEQRVSNSLMLQLAPSVKHQAHGMLSLLRRYSWHSFSILSTDSTGVEHFVRSLRDQMLTIHDYKYTILDVFVFKTRSKDDVKNELKELAKSESRVYLLYCSKNHAKTILEEAKELGLTKKNYVWIVSESIVGSDVTNVLAPSSFPAGMLGIHFNTTHSRLLDEIERAVNIFGNGLESFASNQQHSHLSLTHDLRCNETTDRRWFIGEILFKHLRSVSIRTKTGKPNLEFNQDGTLKYVELNIMNLNSASLWEKIGVWDKNGLEIKDITWPENSPVPPPGVPEKFSLKVTFLEEPPFLNSMNPNNVTGECKTSRSVRCRYAPLSELKNIDKEEAYKNSNYYRCCSGFCIDLLQKFSNDLKFSFELYRVEDSNWGILSSNGSWNGLIQELLDHKADMVVTSIKINSERQAYVDFTVPFLETGITIVVSKRTGIISPKAFLEPFDTTCWVMILLVSIQIAAFAIFAFEWLSPSGYNMGMRPAKGHSFSLFRTYWLVFAILFGAAVPVNCPRGYTARFMSNVWATFAVVFLAIYTANLAAFMITREDFYDFSGMEDPRLANPTHRVPPLKFGTILHGNTEAVLKRNKPRMHAYMKQFNTSKSSEGVKMVRNNNLDAFIYDAVVLDYMAGQDPECKLLTVGSWYAMTGYGFAFPKNSKYLAKFNEKMIEYRENGDLERLRKFWFQGACKTNNKDKGNLEGKLSNPLDVSQFMSAFLLLGCGILLTIALLFAEHLYYRHCRKHLISKEKDPCFTLVSLSMAKSLNTTNEYPLSISNQEHDKLMNLKSELSQEEEIKSELNNKRSYARENSSRRKSRMHPDETNLDNLNRMKINQCQLVQNKNSIKQATSSKHQYDQHHFQQQQQQQDFGNQPCFLPVNKLNYLKLNRLQQQYLNSCACNNNNCELCELGSKQTRAIQQLQRELEMARCELRSLRNCLVLSNSSKQLNCMTYDDAVPVRYACSVPNTPKLQRNNDCYNLECQDCLADLYQPSSMQSIHNISSPCGLEYLLPNVNSCNCYLEEYADQAYDLHLASKKAYEQKKLQEKKSAKSVFLLQNPSSDEMPMPKKTVSTSTNTNLTKLKGTDLQLSSNQTSNEEHLIGNKSKEKPDKPINQVSRLNKAKISLAGMQTFTLDQPDELDDYSLNNLEDYKQQENKDVEKDNDYFNENVCTNVITNVKTQSNSLFNRSKTSKSLTRSLSRDQQFGSLNYSKSESYDENLLYQKNRNDADEDRTKKQSQNSIKNYETTC